jgi:hypothetical protein
MKTNKALLLIRLTALSIVVQMALGGLLTFGFISPEAHIVMGFTVYAVSIATLVLVFLNTYSPVFLKNMTIGMVVLLTMQIFLGFATLATGSNLIAFFHLLLAIAIFGLAISETFVANIAYKRVNMGIANG